MEKLENYFIEQYAAISGISSDELKGRNRKSEIALVRECIWYSLRKNGFELKQIGRIFNRAHSTIYSGIQTVQNLIDINDYELTPFEELLNK